MKQLSLIFLAVLIASNIFAQSAQKMSYQAVIRNNNNTLITNTQVGMQITILRGSTTGAIVYSEIQTPTSNANGLITIEIGSGSDFSNINWANGPYFIKVETDPSGGTNYSISGISQLLSVPYAFFAKTAENISSSAAPSIATQPPTDIQQYSANLQGIVNGKGFKTNVSFEWGLTSSYGNTESPTQSPITGNQDSPIKLILKNLQSNTIYHYRIKAENAVNVVYSNDMTFTTIQSTPQLTTNSVSDILAYSSTTGGNITYDGGSPITSRGVCYSTTPNPTISNNIFSAGNGTGYFSVNLTTLNYGTKYYVRAYATNAIGTTYGNELSFTTQNGTISLTTTAVTDIAGTTALSGGNISSDGGASVIARGICWSTSPNPTTTLATKTVDNIGTGSYTSSLSALVIGTKYYVKAYATNNIGTSYGNEICFTVGAIGTIYMNGIVFYLDATGQHGLACATTNQIGVGSGIGWSNGTYSVTGATGTAIGTGKTNTDAILKKLGAGSYAAQVCNDLAPAGTWFLPSKDELYLMYTVIKAYGYPNSGGYHWSSTESDSINAWEMSLSDGTGYYTSKNDNTRLLRAIRAF